MIELLGKTCSEQERELSWMKNQQKEGEEAPSTCADKFKNFFELFNFHPWDLKISRSDFN